MTTSMSPQLIDSAHVELEREHIGFSVQNRLPELDATITDGIPRSCWHTQTARSY